MQEFISLAHNKSHVYIAISSPFWCLSNQVLYLLFCSEELFYQILLFDFGNFGVIRFTVSMIHVSYSTDST
jgi:hypothetical protein